MLPTEDNYIKVVKVCLRDLLYNPVFTGGEVIFGWVDERNSEVEQQIDYQRTSVLR